MQNQSKRLRCEVDNGVVAMAALKTSRAARNIIVTFTKTDPFFFCHPHAEIVTLRINVQSLFL